MKARTGSFKELVQRHVKSNPAIAEALLRGGIDTMLKGDVAILDARGGHSRGNPR